MKEIQIAFYDPNFDSHRFEEVAEEISQAFPNVIGFGVAGSEAELVLECRLDRLTEVFHQVSQFPLAHFTETGFLEADGEVSERVSLPSASYVVDHVAPG